MKMWIVGLLAVCALAACKNGTLQPGVPALISEPSPEGRAEIEQAVSAALGGGHMTLADDALTGTSVLVVERRARQDPQGDRLPGRVVEQPERFQLRLSGGSCILVHNRTGQRWELRESRCVAEAVSTN